MVSPEFASCAKKYHGDLQYAGSNYLQEVHRAMGILTGCHFGGFKNVWRLFIQIRGAQFLAHLAHQFWLINYLRRTNREINLRFDHTSCTSLHRCTTLGAGKIVQILLEAWDLFSWRESRNSGKKCPFRH